MCTTSLPIPQSAALLQLWGMAFLLTFPQETHNIVRELWTDTVRVSPSPSLSLPMPLSKPVPPIFYGL